MGLWVLLAALALVVGEPVQSPVYSYISHEELNALINQYVARYPTLASTFSIGLSVQQRNLTVIHITKNVGQAPFPGRPMFKYVGNMHGNEVVGRQILINLFQTLLDNYGTDTGITTLVDTTDIYIMPTMNPDGFAASTTAFCGEGGGRENANGVDLNRNFPDQFDPTPNTPEPETALMMQWITSNPFVLSANLHGGSVVASYPFDDTRAGQSVYSRSPDDDVFKSVALVYSQNHLTMHKPGPACTEYYETFPDGITNGAAWYNVPGGMQDFNYLHSNCFEITIELSCCKYPPVSQLPTEWANNREALLAYMAQVHRGIKGFVRDGSSGGVIANAVISVAGIDHVVKSAQFGDYWRLLRPGTYSVTVTADDFQPVTKNGVVVVDGQPTSLNFALPPSTSVLLPDENAINNLFAELATTCPTVFSSYQIGSSVNNRPLMVARLTAVTNGSLPAVKFIGNIHGNEVAGRQVLKDLLLYLCSNHDANATVYALLQTVDIHVLPSLNPDGFVDAIEGDCYGDAGLLNANGIDLATDFYNVSTRYGSLQPETRAVVDWIGNYSFALSASLHAGALVSAYPHFAPPVGVDPATFTSSTTSPTHDDVALVALSTAYALAHGSSVYPNMSLGLACSATDPLHRFNESDEREAMLGGYPRGIVNGFNFLPRSDNATWMGNTGSMSDYNYHNGVLELDIYLECCLFPMAYELPAIWAAHRNSLLGLIASARDSVGGRVFSEYGQPIANAEIVVEYQGAKQIEIWRDAPAHTNAQGYFFRYLPPGGYTLVIRAEGFVRDFYYAVVDYKTPQVFRDIVLRVSSTTTTTIPAPAPANATANTTAAATATATATTPPMPSSAFESTNVTAAASSPATGPTSNSSAPSGSSTSIITTAPTTTAPSTTIGTSNTTTLSPGSTAAAATPPTQPTSISTTTTTAMTGTTVFTCPLSLVFEHHAQDEVDSFLDQAARSFPNIVSIVTVGTSVNGVRFRAIRITDNPTVDEPGEPRFKYVGNMHGNEVVGREMLLHFIMYLLCHYGHDNQVTSLVDSTDIYILPSMNPDGYATASRYEGLCDQNDGRPNAHGVDLNRNFPDQFAPTDPAEPETLALINWITSKQFVLSANFHGGSVVASYPFDNTKSGQSVYSVSPDDDVFRLLAKTYSYAHGIMAEGKGCGDETFPDGITNGAAWYNVPGGMQDFNYLHSNCFEITVELSCCKFPSADVLPDEWSSNRPALLAYLSMVHVGVKGFVISKDSGQRIVGASITVKDRDHAVSSDQFGDYFRLLVPGQTVTLTAAADGYLPASFTVTAANPAVSLNFTLETDTSLAARFRSLSGMTTALVVLTLVLVIPAFIMLSIWAYRTIKARRNFYSALRDTDLDQSSFVKLTQRERELFGDAADDDEVVI